MKFTHLHTHSHYSLLDGLAKIDDLVARAKELGMESLALTDHGNLYGAVEFYSKAKKSGIKPLLGMEAYVAKGSRLDRKLTPSESEGTGKKTKENYNHLTLLCESEKGWKNLLKLSSSSHLEGFYYKPRIDRKILAEHQPKKSEFVDPKRIRDVFWNVSMDLLDELASYKGVQLRTKEKEQCF